MPDTPTDRPPGFYGPEVIRKAIHELRNPLTVIVTLTELMLNDPYLSAVERTEYLGMVRDQAMEMGRVLDGLHGAMKNANGH